MMKKLLMVGLGGVLLLCALLVFLPTPHLTSLTVQVGNRSGENGVSARGQIFPREGVQEKFGSRESFLQVWGKLCGAGPRCLGEPKTLNSAVEFCPRENLSHGRRVGKDRALHLHGPHCDYIPRDPVNCAPQ
jgi:hypothetical protein